MDPKVEEMVKQYELAAAFAEEFTAEVGEQRAGQIMARAFEKVQAKTARELAKRLGSNSIEALADHYRRLEKEKDNLELLEVTDRHIAMKISRCRAWEAFKHLGAPEICRLYCESDYAYIKAFNPKMKLIRTKTIAAGDEYCDHIWALED